MAVNVLSAHMVQAAKQDEMCTAYRPIVYV